MVPFLGEKGVRIARTQTDNRNGTISKHDAPPPNLPRRNTTNHDSHPQPVINNASERPRYTDPLQGSLEAQDPQGGATLLP